MDFDAYSVKFASAVLCYLRGSENYALGETDVDTIVINDDLGGDKLEYVTETAKAVIVLSALKNPSFHKTMEDYFDHHTINRRNVSTFLTKLCFDNYVEMDDIFTVVLNTFAFVYRVSLFCHNPGHGEFVKLAYICWVEIFQTLLRAEFRERGGWGGFKTYVAENRYLSKDGETDQKAIVEFLEDIGYLFPNLTVQYPDQQPSNYSSSEAIAHAEASCEEGTDKPPTNDEAAEFSFGTVASNIPGFNEKSEACVEGLDDPQTNEAAEFSFGTAASHVFSFNGKSKARMEVVDELQTNGDTGFSFGTVDLIASNIPGFNEKCEAVVFEFDNPNAKIMKPSKKSKLKLRGVNQPYQ